MKFWGQTFGYPAVAVGFISLKSKLIYKKCLSCWGFRLETFRAGTFCDPESLKGGGDCNILNMSSNRKIQQEFRPTSPTSKSKATVRGRKAQCYRHDTVSACRQQRNRRIAEKFNISTIRSRKWKTHAETYKDCMKIWSLRRIWDSSLLVRRSMRGTDWT